MSKCFKERKERASARRAWTKSPFTVDATRTTTSECCPQHPDWFSAFGVTEQPQPLLSLSFHFLRPSSRNDNPTREKKTHNIHHSKPLDVFASLIATSLH
jgi:hypothetical protein